MRAIDHLSWSPGSAGTADEGPSKSKRARKAESVNGYSVAHEKHRHDTLDVLIAAMRRYRKDVGSVPALIKASGSTPVCARRVHVQFHAVAGRCGHSFSQNTCSACAQVGMWRRVPGWQRGVLGRVHVLAAVCAAVFWKVFVSQHTACPFGAVASVHAWERVGAAIAHVARKYLKISVLRYVDDFFRAGKVPSCQYPRDASVPAVVVAGHRP